MLVLKALQLEPMHGWGITERIEQWSEQVLQLGQGTLYPALYRLERQGLIRSEWKVTDEQPARALLRPHEEGRRYFADELAHWRRLSRAINLILDATLGDREGSTCANCGAGCGTAVDCERGLDEEIRFHIDQQTEKNLRAGMTPDEARRQAFVKFGGVEHVKEQTRDEFRPALLEDFLRDLRYGVRLLFARPAFAIVAILTLGLGIGAATAVFSVVDGVLLRPLPYPDPDRIVRLSSGRRQRPAQRNVSEPNFEDWKTGTRSFSAMAEMSAGPTPVSHRRRGHDDAGRRRLARVLRRHGRAAARRPRLPARGTARRGRAGGDRRAIGSGARASAARRSTR